MKYPNDFEIYSPEASDDQRFGDWQTHLVTVAILVAAILGLALCSARADMADTAAMFKSVNALASSLDGCDVSEDNRNLLAALDNKQRELTARMRAYGFVTDRNGDWVRR